MLIIIIGYIVFAHFNLHIPPSQQVKQLVYSDYYSGNHFVLNSSSKLYEITIEDFLSSDKVSRSSIYSFSCVIDGKHLKASLEYPGTPKRQYYGFPRLSHNEKYILITSQEISSAKNITLASAYYLFLIQVIDGIEYAYPCIYDASMIPLSIISSSKDFKYIRESRIYDSHNDADVCDYLKKHSQTNPEWSYKLLADDLRNHYHLLLKR